MFSVILAFFTCETANFLWTPPTKTEGSGIDLMTWSTCSKAIDL